MDFQKISDSEEELQLLEAKKLYPPRFVITITGSNNAENSLVSFIFEGATQEIAKQISLKKGIIHVVTKLLFDIYGMIMGDTLEAYCTLRLSSPKRLVCVSA